MVQNPGPTGTCRRTRECSRISERTSPVRRPTLPHSIFVVELSFTENDSLSSQTSTKYITLSGIRRVFTLDYLDYCNKSLSKWFTFRRRSGHSKEDVGPYEDKSYCSQLCRRVLETFPCRGKVVWFCGPFVTLPTFVTSWSLKLDSSRPWSFCLGRSRTGTPDPTQLKQWLVNVRCVPPTPSFLFTHVSGSERHDSGELVGPYAWTSLWPEPTSHR